MSKLKYGIVDSSQNPLVPVTNASVAFYGSQVFKALSGRFCTYDDSYNYWKASESGDNKIGGYCDDVLTTSSTNGGSKLPVFDVRGHTFELPYANATSVTTQLTQATLDDLIGKNCDLYVSANVQYADGGATTDNIFRIVGGDPNSGYGTLWVQVLDSAIGYIS